MTRGHLIVCCLLVMLLIASPAGGSQDVISLVEPQDRSVLAGKWLSVVIHLEGDVDRVVLSRNRKEIENIRAPEGGQYLCTAIEIDFGPNEVGVQAMKDNRTVGTKEISVFYKSDISRVAAKPPPEFQTTHFHRAEREQGCRPCHNMEAERESAGKDSIPGKPEHSTCYRCHWRTTSYDNVHGPAATWSCFSCHDRDSTPFKYATRKPDSTSCFLCHSDSKTEWAAKKYVHGPTATGKCTVCHNPHASNNQFFLKKATWSLCVSCHEEMGTGAHILKLYALINGGHPTRGVRDPSRPGKMLSCASCHNPHAANTNTLFAFDAGNLIFNFCNRCHKK